MAVYQVLPLIDGMLNQADGGGTGRPRWKASG